MTPDEAKHLLGGYATGTLTPEERQVLFSAALTDQSLFDELAKEQALKEALDDPSIRAELLHDASSRKNKRWMWWAVPSIAAGLAAITVGVVNRKPEPVEVASRDGAAPQPELRAEVPATVVAAPPTLAVKAKPAAKSEKTTEPVTMIAEQAPLPPSVTTKAQPMGALMARSDAAAAIRIDRDLILVPPNSATLRIESNAAGFVYVLHRASDGSWDAVTPGGVNIGAHAPLVTNPFFTDGRPVAIIFSRDGIAELPMTGSTSDSVVEAVRSRKSAALIVIDMTAGAK